MKSFKLEVTYVNPRDPTAKYHHTIGPVFGKAVVNRLLVELMRKRNVVGVKTEEVTSDGSGK